jgi:hypothetical protein
MIDGNKFTSAYTLASMFDQDSIAVSMKSSDGKEYRIKASEILKLIQQHVFKVEKARRYHYLQVIKEEPPETFSGYCPCGYEDAVKLEGTKHLGCSTFSCFNCGKEYYVDENNYVTEVKE